MIFLVYAMIIFRSIIYGSSVFFTDKLVSATEVWDVIALRFLMTGVVFLLLRLLGIIKVNFKGKNMKPLVFAAVFEPILYFIFETFGISQTSNLTSGIIIAFTPILVCILQEVILKEKTSLLQKLCLLCGVGGVAVTVVCTGNNTGADTFLGIGFMFLAVLSGALYIIFSRKSSQEFTTMEITYFAGITGAVIFNVINVARHVASGTLSSYFLPYASVDNLIGFVFLSVVSTIIATACNNFAISKIQAARVSAFGGISTVVTIVEGVLLNGEKLYYFHIIGTALILISAVGVNYLAEKKPLKNKE